MIKKICALGVMLVVVVLVGGVASRPAFGQDFLCTGGPKDGVACASDDECFVSCPSSYGACVLVQGVCNGGEFDGFPCDCPGGTCVGTGTTGTCQGGAFAGDACTTTVGEGSCNSGIACVGTQKVCQSGDLRGFGCLNNNQCSGASCVSTGKFCDGGDFSDYSCVVDADCTAGTTAGTCRTPDVTCTSPTPTPSATRSRTPSRTATGGGTPLPTTSPTRTPSGGTPAATRTPTPTGGFTPLATASATPTIPNSGTVAVTVPAGSSLLPLTDASKLPLSGSVAQIGDTPTCISYTRRPEGNVLGLNPPLTAEVPAGTVVRIGPCIVTQTYEQQSCAISRRPGSGGLWLIGIAGLGWLGRRLRRA